MFRAAKKDEEGRTAKAYTYQARPAKWSCPGCDERFNRKDERDRHLGKSRKCHKARFPEG